MLRTLLIGRRGYGDDAIDPRIDRRDEAADRPTLPGSVPSFEQDHGRALPVPGFPGQLRDLGLQLLEVALVLFRGNRLRQVDPIEDVTALFDWRGRRRCRLPAGGR